MLFKILTVLLLCAHGKFHNANSFEVSSTLATDLEYNVEAFSNSSITHLEDVDEDTEMVEAQPLHTAPAQPTQPAPAKGPARNGRQLFYNPSVNFIRSYAEGAKCITAQGQAGACVGFSSCPQYYRFRRQLTYITLQQWPQPFPQFQQDICSFYDVYGRPNSGICCTNAYANIPTYGLGGTLPAGPPLPPPFYVPIRPIYGGAQPPVRPMPPPPPPPPAAENPNREDTDDEDDTQSNHNGDEDNIEINGGIINEQQNNVDNQNTDNAMDNSPDFQDENSVDPSKDNGNELPIPVTYDDYRYQWPSSTQFGHFSGVAQWPPPIPTHPPSTANWPPPIPTHPPNHHYPTHPPTQTRPTAPPATTTLITTKRTPPVTVTTRRATARPTTRRPNYPSYPSYPGYPSYPSYPSYRPTTTTVRPTTTTRRPTTGGGTTGTSAYGLPLQCGVKNPVSPDQERIVGGTNASPYEFPWIAVMFKSGKQFCGGTLITNNHILTAAHCVARMTSWDVAAVTVHLGDYNIRTDFEVKHVERRVKRLVRHKGFDFSTLHNDIAILTLNEPVKFTHEIQPICLPTSSAQQSRSYSGQQATVAGWGSIRENGPQPSILQKTQIPIWSNSDCARKYGRAAPAGIIESMICAGQASKDSCSGDSGGPLIVNDGGRYTQVGIVSWGIGCGKGQYPGVYTRVTALLPWIYKNIK